MAKTKTKKSKAEPEEELDLDFEDLELDDEDEDDDSDEEIEDSDDEDEDDEDDDDDEDEKPKAKKGKSTAKKSKREEIAFGAKDLAAHVSEVTGEDYDARALRILLRKMAKKGEIARDPEGDARSRYSWSGPTDPEVKKIVAAVKKGAIKEARAESLNALKERKTAAKEESSSKKSKKKTKAKA